MGLIIRAKTNIFFKFIGETLSRIIAILFFIYVARKLGDVDFGKYSFAQSFCTLFMVLLDLGLNTLLIRNISREKSLAVEYISNITAIKLILSCVTFLLIILMIKILGYSKEMVNLVILMSFVNIGVALLEYLSAIFNAWEKMDYEAIVKIFNKVIVAFLGASALFIGFGLNVFVGFMGVGYLLTIIFGLVLIGIKILPVRFYINLKLWKNLLSNALPLALTTIFIIIYFRIDIVLLSLFHKSNAEIGWYSASIKLKDTLGALPFLVMGGVFPIFSDLARNSPEKLVKVYEKLFRYLLILGIPVAFGVTILAQKLVILIFGNNFIGSISSLKIIIWGIVFMFGNYVLMNLLVAIDKQKVNAIATGLAIFVNILVNIVLIPEFGYLGASVATVVTEIFLFTVCFGYVSKYFAVIPLFKTIWKPIFAGISMFAVLYYIKELNLFLMILIGIVIYTGVLYILKTFSAEDKEIFYKLIKIAPEKI